MCFRVTHISLKAFLDINPVCICVQYIQIYVCIAASQRFPYDQFINFLFWSNEFAGSTGLVVVEVHCSTISVNLIN